MSQSDADRAAAAAVVAHHTHLEADLVRRVRALRDAATEGDAATGAADGAPWRDRQRELLDWLRTELLPHAAAEEKTLYPAAAALSDGRLLVDGMLGEHRAITAVVAELEQAGTAVDAVAAARALSALFETHLAKENDLILPLLLGDGRASLAGLLAGMHDLLGAAQT